MILVREGLLPPVTVVVTGSLVVYAIVAVVLFTVVADLNIYQLDLRVLANPLAFFLDAGNRSFKGIRCSRS